MVLGAGFIGILCAGVGNYVYIPEEPVFGLRFYTI